MKSKVILLFILLLALFLRFYNLMWDAPYFFNPDERNMAIAITKFSLPFSPTETATCFINQTPEQTSPICNLNPEFFAYGQFPLYIAYFAYYIYSFFQTLVLRYLNIDITYFRAIPFPVAIFWLRVFAASASTISVLVVYKISTLIFKNNKLLPLLTSLFVAFTPQLIQSAHFGTTESLLLLLYLLIIYACLKLINGKYQIKKFIIVAGLSTGLALATKVSSLLFAFIPILILIIINKRKLLNILYYLLTFLLLTLIIYVIFSPFNSIDFAAFQSSISYESSVAIGSVKVFYTRQFENTIPVLFQLIHIFPYSLGFPLFVIGIGGFIFSTVIIIRKWITSKHLALFESNLLFLIVSFLAYFIPTSFLYAKWTRFMTPIISFFPLFAGVLIYFVLVHFKNNLIKLTVYIASFCIIIPGVSFFSLYLRSDVRVRASVYIYDTFPSQSYVLSETANVVDIPLGQSEYLQRPQNYMLTVISFNFYELDNNPQLEEALLTHLKKADYILIPSRRVFKNLEGQCDVYPLASAYYQSLFSGELGFEHIQTIMNFPTLTIFNKKFVLNDESAEETYTVFDHPVVRIYKKEKSQTKEEYEKLLEAPCTTH